MKQTRSLSNFLAVIAIGAAAAPLLASGSPSVTNVSVSGTNVVFNCVVPGGCSGVNYVVLFSTNLALPMSQWTPMATNSCGADGAFCFTNGINPTQPATYFTFTLNVAVTVQSGQSGASFSVDGTNFTSSQTFAWAPGSSHTIATTAPQSGGTGIQYLWNGWSDGGAMTHVISPAVSAAYTVNFMPQYYLTISASTGGSASPNSGWESVGVVIPISATPNTPYVFSNWTGTGSGSYSGGSSSSSVTMNGPITELAAFTTNAPANIVVHVTASPSTESFSVDGANYSNNHAFSWVPYSSHTIATTTPQSGGTGIQYVWSSWSDSGAMSHTVNPGVNTTYTANFAMQYQLAMSTNGNGTVSPNTLWTNGGAVISISATPSPGYVFSNWTGGGIGSNYTGTNNPAWVSVTRPVTETANFYPTPAAISSFTMNSNLGVAPFTVTFTDTSSNNPTSWYWTFGDGGTSTIQNPTHLFTNMWRQTVSLTVSNSYGSTTSSQPVFQCFPCDALYDWTGGTQGQVAQIASLSNSMVPGSSLIGYFTTTNRNVPQNNLLGIMFTNLPGMTNGCPVVFSNGTIYSNFNSSNAIAYSFTNDWEQYDFHFNSSLVITDIVLLFYDSMPLSSSTWFYCCDELNIATTKEGPGNGSGVDLGLYCLNRNLGISGPMFPLGVNENNFHTSETCNPTIYGQTPYSWLTNMYFPGQDIYEYPDKIYRILMEENTNGLCVLAVADPATSSLVGFVTNWNLYEQGHLITGYADGHTSWETYTTNNLPNWSTCTSILANHSIISINRPLSWYQATNVAMFGP